MSRHHHRPSGAEVNTTTIANCLPENEEFLLGSETNRRILQARKGGTITYSVVRDPKTNCDRNIASSCTGQARKIYDERPCHHVNLCAARDQILSCLVFFQFPAIIQSAAAAALIVLLFHSANLQTAECHSAAPDAAACNATRIGDCLAEGEEFLMESETNRRILQAGKGGKMITYPVINNPSKSYCDRDVYGSCIGKESKIYKDRPCNYQNQCARP